MLCAGCQARNYKASADPGRDPRLLPRSAEHAEAAAAEAKATEEDEFKTAEEYAVNKERFWRSEHARMT